ncbi:MAG: 16S rRNA (guanine(966)-N(2))-methyltransferase RsmD [Clostridiales bacterium]|nr:16S rRNA (guanine(966)-N(2))-methyltransferase RsmD [Clostridiales bacterium]
MRVITGSARGRKLQTLEGRDVRPTTDKVKEALFSIIQFEIEGRRVLDMFAGSGQLGIEALSRGAKNATFIDASKRAVEIIKANIKATGFENVARVVNNDSVLEVKTSLETYDLAFLDPPYSTGLIQKALPVVAESMAQGGIIICETPSGEELPENVGDFKLNKIYKYGKTWLQLYR